MTTRRRVKQTKRQRTRDSRLENPDLRNHQLNFPLKSIQLLCNLRDKMGKENRPKPKLVEELSGSHKV